MPSSMLSIDQLAWLYAEVLASKGLVGLPRDAPCEHSTSVDVGIDLLQRFLPPDVMRERVLGPMADQVGAKLRGARVGSVMLPPPKGALEAASARRHDIATLVFVRALAGPQGALLVHTFTIVHESIPATN